MLTGIDESRLAHSLLMILTNSKKPVVTLFYDTYAAFFSPGKMPVLDQIDMGERPMLVKVDRDKAITYLKNQYQFLSREEMVQTLNTAAKEFEESHGQRE